MYFLDVAHNSDQYHFQAKKSENISRVSAAVYG